jgi:hypothetical protein
MSQKTFETRYKIYETNGNWEVVSDFACGLGNIVKNKHMFWSSPFKRLLNLEANFKI